MQIRTLVLLVAVLCSLVFIFLNWGAISAPGPLNLGVVVVQAPLGLVLLGILTVLSALFMGVITHLQTTLLVESRRHTKELEAQRTLANSAEASRFTELRQYLEAATLANIERQARHEAAVRAAVEETGNVVAAHLGELEDRLERAGLRGIPEGRA
ncbi:hypothetical protein [Uliginosibacterium sp. H1]|uniref:hypothetical protein n=1 Tax=Uliginosibacterium sp. H1 TaxID=3114757 RepID=UPI002E1756E9|nr:hypothetical protein [Uliginosibacterium sp. H1]